MARQQVPRQGRLRRGTALVLVPAALLAACGVRARVPVAAGPTATSATTGSAPVPSPASSPRAPRATAGLSVEVDVPEATGTARIVTVAVQVRDDAGELLRLRVAFGDGVVEESAPTRRRCSSAAPAPAPPLELTRAFRHAYRHVGVYVVAASAVTEGCVAGMEAASAEDRIPVAPGPSLSNGPFPPRVGVEGSRPGARRTVLLTVVGADRDGYVSGLAVDWGEGGRHQRVSFPLTECVDPKRFWPRSRTSVTLSHTYARTGRYRVKVWAESVGCDGKDTQRAQASTDLVA